MKAELLCTEKGCERRWVRTRDGRKVCSWHPGQQAPDVDALTGKIRETPEEAKRRQRAEQAARRAEKAAFAEFEGPAAVEADPEPTPTPRTVPAPRPAAPVVAPAAKERTPEEARLLDVAQQTELIALRWAGWEAEARDRAVDELVCRVDDFLELAAPNLTRKTSSEVEEPDEAAADPVAAIPLPVVSPLSAAARCQLVRGEEHHRPEVRRAARVAREALEQLLRALAAAERRTA